jgi:8-oxo-dGTP diphosphatase
MTEVIKKPIQLSVNCFIRYKDEFLLLKRSPDKKIDPGKVNCIGGKVEPGEDYVTAAIREVAEETGYNVGVADMRFCGIIDFSEGYEKEWVACFFHIIVSDKVVPIGMKTTDGELKWVHKDDVLTTNLDLVDDVNNCFPLIVEEQKIFFMNVKHNELAKVSDARVQLLEK